jgi:hypothetical protein
MIILLYPGKHQRHQIFTSIKSGAHKYLCEILYARVTPRQEQILYYFNLPA